MTPTVIRFSLQGFFFFGACVFGVFGFRAVCLARKKVVERKYILDSSILCWNVARLWSGPLLWISSSAL